MDIFLIAIISGLDGFFMGIAYGLQNTRFTRIQLCILTACSLIFGFLAMLTAGLVADLVSASAAKSWGGVLLILAGVLSLRESASQKNNAVKPLSRRNIWFLSTALALDSSVALFSLGLTGQNPILVPVVFTLVATLLLMAGNILGKLGYEKLQSSRYFQSAPAYALIALGVLRLLPSAT